ncbi:MAG: VWA domain-containing protein, partial [Candidatus Latescibacterota bacterium]
AFARPTIQSGGALFLPGEAPKHVVVCLDVSYSMGAEREEGTVFSAAQRLAGQVVDECGRNDVINVVAFSKRGDVLFESGTRNKRIVTGAINDLVVTAEGTAINRATGMAAELIAESSLSIGEIYVVSDFRDTGDTLTVPELPENTQLVLIPVDGESIDNVSIDRVLTPRKLIRPGETVRIGVSVTNHSRERSVEFPLELIVGGKRKAEKIVNLAPASSATETFVVSFADRGVYRCRVVKNRDRLAIDDDRYFVLDVSDKIPVTLVRGRKPEGPARGQEPASYFYLDKALNPRGTAEGEFTVDGIDQSDITVADLPNRGVVVWTEPRPLDDRRFDLLKRYIQRGGALMVWLGGDRRGFWRDERFAGYLGIRRGIPTTKNEGDGLGSFAKGHPVFSIFSEEELELLSRTRVNRYLTANGIASDSVLVYFGSGAPAMWECTRGNGRILVVSSPPDLESGNLPLSPMFLPLVHTAVAYLANSNQRGTARENLVGEDLFFELPAKWTAQTGELRVLTGAGGETRPILYEATPGDVKAMLPRPQDVGFYTLLADTTRVVETSINVDTRESNLNARDFDDDELAGARIVEVAGNFRQNLRRETQGREIYAVFLLLAISALVAEALLGRKA